MADLVYDGFISYSHAADGLLAPRLQAGLQRFAKPWWKRRAVRIFRDESSLSANPHLWSSITEALDSSGWFVLLLSPDAARSEWVNQEIAYWKTNRDPSRILPVVTDGEFGWADGDVTGDAVPEQLRGVFLEEPRWVDLRFAKGEEHLDLKNARFAAAVADIASALRGVPKDELESEEVTQHRRTIRTAWAAGGLVTVLAIAAVGFGIQSASNAAEAERQAEIALANAEEAGSHRDRAEEEANRANVNEALATSRELAASAISVLDDDPELATLLAIRAIDEAPASAEVPVEVVRALWRAGGANRLVDALPAATEQYVSVSPDGRLLAVSGAQRLAVMDSSTLEEIWAYEEDTVDTFTYSDFSADGRLAIGIVDSTAIDPTLEPDALPNRIVILDVATGEVGHTILLPECTRSELPSWSPDASRLALSSGDDGCDRNGVVHWIEVVDTTDWQTAALLPFDLSQNGPLPRWDQSGRLYAMRPFEETVVFEAGTFETVRTLSWGGTGDVSPDGTTMVLGIPVAAPLQSSYVVDAETGLVRDVLPSPSQPSVPGGILLSDDGRWAFVGAAGGYTRVYELATGDLLRRLPTGNVESLAYDAPTARLFTTGGRVGLKIWDLRAGVIGVEQTGDLDGFDVVGSNSFKSIGARMAFIAFDPSTFRPSLRFFDPVSGLVSDDAIEDFRMMGVLGNGTVFGHDSGIGRNVTLDPTTGDRTVLDDLCAEVQEHGVGWQECEGTDGPWVFEMTASTGGELLAVGRDSGGAPTGDLVSIDPSTGRIVERMTDTRLPIGGRGVVTDEWVAGNTETGLEIVSRITGELLYSGPAGGLFELSSTGTLLAFETEQTEAVVLDTRSWVEVVRVERAARIRGLSFDLDEGRIAVSDNDSLAIVNLVTGSVVPDLGLPGVSDVHWIDAETVVVGTNDGVFGTLSISTEAFLESTRAALRRSFTEQECTTYRIDPCPTLEEMRDG